MPSADYVIVGAGSAGCVLANRLTEDPGVRVLLLEAGGRDLSPNIKIPVAFSKQFHTKLDWDFATEPEPFCDGRSLYMPRGKSLGGSSSMNAMLYVRGRPLDFDIWEARGATGWGWGGVLPYFMKAENNERGASEFHATGGPMNVADQRSPRRMNTKFIAAAEAAGIPRIDDYNGPEQDGVSMFQVLQRGGRRWSTADGYLRPAMGRDNLKVVTGAQALNLEFEGNRFVHGPQITAGIAVIQALGSAHGFVVDQTADATLINQANLGQYAVVVFLNTTGDILDAAQQLAFEGYVMSGGGFVGVHSATDTEYGWPFYGSLIGAWFLNHPAIQTATVNVVDPTHPSTAMLPAVFSHDDEWYNFQTNVASNPLVNVLLTVDESTYAGGSMGAVHPIAWCQDSGMGRSWYTAIGHTLATYSMTAFADHILGGILWAAGSTRTSTICAASAYGSPSGVGSLALAGILGGGAHATIQLSGASPGAPGLLGVGSCAASAAGGGVTVLVDLASPGFLGLIPFSFDALGQWQTLVPLVVQLPGSWGINLYLQGAQTSPALSLSNGLHLTLCP